MKSNPVNTITPLELLNLYYSKGTSLGNQQNKVWKKTNQILSWENILHNNYQADLCPLLFFVITKELPKMDNQLPYNNGSKAMVSESIFSQLREHYKRSLKRNMILLEELDSIINELKKKGIKVIVFKGAFLAENVYKNIACRPMGDIDVLISKKNFDRSSRILQDLGYRNVSENYRIKMLHSSFYKDLGGERLKLEIHHRLAKEVFMTNFNLEEIWDNDGLTIEYNIAYLSWHSIRHGIARFLWICDIAEIIKRNHSAINWENIDNRVISCNIEKQMKFILGLTQNLLTFKCEQSKHYHISTQDLYENLFIRLQKNMLRKKCINILSNLLTMCLMRPRDIIKYIPRFIHYKYIYRPKKYS